MAALLEAVMLTCFGLSWPINAYKSYKSGTAAGSSWQFLALITFGYFAGIAAKFVGNSINWVIIVYVVNLACLAVNWAVYFRNRKLDAAAELIAASEELKQKSAARSRAVRAAEEGYIEGVNAK
ncbi:MAG: hypothetical protein RR917_03505 [Eggerthellaceae bacterium]